MATYNQIPFTVTADDQIPADAPLSAGMTEAELADLVSADQEYTIDLLTLELSVEPHPALNAHAVVTWENHVLHDDYETHINWGDGVDEYASADDEGHPYSQAGMYEVRVTVSSREGEPSLQRTATVTVPDPPVVVP